MHSREARLRRHARAVQRGFWRPPSSDAAAVLVPPHLATRVRSMAKSLAIHDDHNSRTGRPLHFARQAALAAPCDRAEMRSALAAHRAANRAKHSWTTHPRGSWADLSADPADPEEVHVSGLAPSSPWAESFDVCHRQSSSSPRASAPTFQEALVQTDDVIAHVVDDDFARRTPRHDQDLKPVSTDPAGALINAQNFTISLLTAELEAWRQWASSWPSHGAGDLVQRVEALEVSVCKTTRSLSGLTADLHRLAGSLSSTVETMVSAKIDAVRAPSIEELTASVANSLLPDLLEHTNTKILACGETLEGVVQDICAKAVQEKIGVVLGALQARLLPCRPVRRPSRSLRPSLHEMPLSSFLEVAAAVRAARPHLPQRRVVSPVSAGAQLHASCDVQIVAWYPPSCGVDASALSATYEDELMMHHCMWSLHGSAGLDALGTFDAAGGGGDSPQYDNRGLSPRLQSIAE